MQEKNMGHICPIGRSGVNHLFSKKIVICLKSSNIEGNPGRSASYLISVDAKYSSG